MIDPRFRLWTLPEPTVLWTLKDWLSPSDHTPFAATSHLSYEKTNQARQLNMHDFLSYSIQIASQKHINFKYSLTPKLRYRSQIAYLKELDEKVKTIDLLSFKTVHKVNKILVAVLKTFDEKTLNQISPPSFLPNLVTKAKIQRTLVLAQALPKEEADDVRVESAMALSSIKAYNLARHAIEKTAARKANLKCIFEHQVNDLLKEEHWEQADELIRSAATDVRKFKNFTLIKILALQRNEHYAEARELIHSKIKNLSRRTELLKTVETSEIKTKKNAIDRLSDQKDFTGAYEIANSLPSPDKKLKISAIQGKETDLEVDTLIASGAFEEARALSNQRCEGEYRQSLAAKIYIAEIRALIQSNRSEALIVALDHLPSLVPGWKYLFHPFQELMTSLVQSEDFETVELLIQNAPTSFRLFLSEIALREKIIFYAKTGGLELANQLFATGGLRDMANTIECVKTLLFFGGKDLIEKGELFDGLEQIAQGNILSNDESYALDIEELAKEFAHKKNWEAACGLATLAEIENQNALVQYIFQTIIDLESFECAFEQAKALLVGPIKGQTLKYIALIKSLEEFHVDRLDLSL